MYVSLSHVTAFAKTLVKDADNINTNVWREWVYNALLNLGIGDDEIDVAELTPIGDSLTVPIPPNCRHILELSLFKADGTQLTHKFRSGVRRLFSDKRVSDSVSVGISDGIPVDVSNDDTSIILGTNGGQVATILIRYFKYPLDENDDPKIREEDVMACAYFIKFMESMRNNSNRSEVAQYEQMWYREADRARARKKMGSMTEDKAKTMLKDMMRLIPSFRHSQF
jgi:hypothetical protein